MTRRWILGTAVAVALFAIVPTAAHDGSVNFDDHYLIAACNQNLRFLRAGIVETENGPAMQFGPMRAGTATFYCNVEADLFHNWIQLIAEDNDVNGWVTASLYRQQVSTFGGPGLVAAPELLVTVTTTDQPGVQVAELFFDPAIEPDETTHMFYIKVEMFRVAPSVHVRAYSVSLRDVL